MDLHNAGASTSVVPQSSWCRRPQPCQIHERLEGELADSAAHCILQSWCKDAGCRPDKSTFHFMLYLSLLLLCMQTVHRNSVVSDNRVSMLQGPKEWEARTGCPLQDLPLLHELSCSSPDTFWPAVLHELRIKFHTPPSR